MISFPFFFSVSGILLSLSTFYDDISQKKFSTPVNTKGTARTTAHVSKKNIYLIFPLNCLFLFL